MFNAEAAIGRASAFTYDTGRLSMKVVVKSGSSRMPIWIISPKPGKKWMAPLLCCSKRMRLADANPH